MKIKRYLDKDMRRVLKRVREDQGPEAVILSNRRVDDGIEVIAAVDYDEALVRHAIGNVPDPNEKISSDQLASNAENDVREETVAAVEEPEKAIPEPAATSAAPEIVASDLMSRPVQKDVALQHMQSEISSLRSLMETQLDGLIWNDRSKRYPMHAQMLRNLARLGVAPDIADNILEKLEPVEDTRSLWNAPLGVLAQSLPVIDDDLMTTGGVVAVIGPTGVGKTTTIAKIAARYAMNNWADQIALVSADAYRIGAREHLQAFANIIGCQVYAASGHDELEQTLGRLSDKKLVLIDTEGRSQRDRELASRLSALSSIQDRVRFYLALSAATQEAALDETIREFSAVPLHGCVVTKIDEAAQLGCVISALIRNKLPLAWMSDGQRVPEDLHAAGRKKLWFVNQAVDCMESSEPQINERNMADAYSKAGVAHA